MEKDQYDCLTRPHPAGAGCAWCDNVTKLDREIVEKARREHAENVAYAQYMNVEEHFIFGG